MSARPLLLKGGRIVDPAQEMDATGDVVIVDGAIAAVGSEVDAPEGAEVVDVSGKVVIPGLIDPHVHLREPGQEHKETIATGARSAAEGGFTAVVAMPNTDPVIDSPALVAFVKAEGEKVGASRVYPTGAISLGLKGERLAPIGEMLAAGAVAITDDGHPVMDSGLMRMALDYARGFGVPVADHPEDLGLSAGGQMNEGLVSTRLGLRGKPNASEDVHIVRDLLVAEFTGGHIHLQHVSTAFGVEMIRQAKARGVNVTAEATPHHLVLTDEAVDGYRTEAKMNPPLRTEVDRAAVEAGMLDGTLDTIATDHAPHHYDEKEAAFDDAPNGIVGLETSVGIILDRFVHTGKLTLAEMVDRMSAQPARTFKLEGGDLKVGTVGDVTVLDLDRSWTVDRDAFASKSSNTPFHGWELKGKAVMTVVGGRVIYRDD